MGFSSFRCWRLAYARAISREIREQRQRGYKDYEVINSGATRNPKGCAGVCCEEYHPARREYDRTGEFPPFLVEAAQAGKYFAMAIPKKYGGLEYDSVTQAVVCEEWGYGCAGMATTLGATMLGTDPVLIAGNEDQKKRFFGAIVNGAIAAFGLTEPGVGSDAGGLKTTAVRSGDEYILNGNKCFITNGAYARVFVICAKTDPSKGLKGISAFIVEKDRPGFTVGGAEHKLGIRSS